ncbi:MAG: caspase domain-containing protein [Cyclobacteriaceae bacterium]
MRILSLRDKTDYSVDLPTSEVSAINFMHPKPFVLASTLEGFVAIIEPKKKYQLFLLPMNEDGYVVYNPKSFDFDGTEQAFNKIYLTRGYEFIDFSQLKERYYKPNLLGRFISNNYQESDALPKITEKEMYPKVACKESGSNTHFVTVTNQGGGIGKVSLLLNGLEIKDDIRPKGLSQHSHTFQYRIDWTTFKNLKTGVNCLEIVAWNGSNWLHSPPIRICKHHNTKGATAEVGDQKPARPNPNIYILSVGVADYEGEKIDLKYSAKDAESMSQALQLGATKLFGAEKAFVYTLTDNSERKPSKANIEKAFREIAAKSSPHDILIVYLSGHGINWGGDTGDFYYLTSTAFSTDLQAYNDPAIRTSATISSKELTELFKSVPSDKRVLMIDACASGKMVENLVASRDVSSSTLRALDRLRDRTGFHIITGCAADAVSYEASRFGQGVLTYSLIEGIKGASLREEKFVDVNQLFQYAKERVPTLAKGIGGIQSPQVFSPQGAQSFDIGELDDELKRKIPLPKTRPLYVRSQLIDETKFRDVLGLSRLLDEALNETSAKGESAPLLFVDVAEYPEGCQVSGLYRQTPTGISVKLNKTCDGKEQTYTLEAANSQALTAAILAWLSQSQ